jgi:nucleoside 2-deoxyribosyltransferase
VVESTNPKTCYLVSATGADTAGIRRALEQLSISPLSPDRTSPVGESVPKSLRQMMRKADFVVGVLDGGEDRENVLFELGVAIGLNRPLFLLVPPELSTNFSLQSYPMLQAPLNDVSAIVFHLRQFLRNITKRRPPALLPTTKSSEKVGLAWLEDLATTASTLDERQLEQQISYALSRAGFATSVEPSFPADGKILRPDLVAWFDSAPTIFGNPLLIEVKRNLGDHRNIAIAQVKRYLNAAKLRTAIVIAGSGADDVEFEQADVGYIFILSAETFLKELARGSLFDTLIRRRNLAAHGG